MKPSSYLYGDLDVTELRELPYVSALHKKNIYAKELLEALFKLPYSDNNVRINDICKAIAFNEVLIKECFVRATDTE